MKLVNLKQFRELPELTMYRKYNRGMFSDVIEIKGETWEADFLCSTLGGDPAFALNSLEDEFEAGDSFMLSEHSFGRDGLFEENQMFAVFEYDDLVEMKKVIDLAIEVTASLRK